MPITTTKAATPRYVLMDGDLRIGPKVVPLDPGLTCSPIYGFSDRRAYERFWMDNQQGLTPYPLVKDHLRNLIAGAGEAPTLVVLDAEGPHEPGIQAATTDVVLEAQENRATQLSAEYSLTFNPEIGAYEVDEVAN